MTENEAIKVINDKYETFFALSTTNVFDIAMATAIKALEEIQQYRAIGLTPELIEAMQGHNVALINDLGEYQAIGTVEEFKALKEKNEPKKIDIWANGEEHCPFCDKNLTTFYGFANCFSCGQKLDWE